MKRFVTQMLMRPLKNETMALREVRAVCSSAISEEPIREECGLPPPRKMDRGHLPACFPTASLGVFTEDCVQTRERRVCNENRGQHLMYIKIK